MIGTTLGAIWVFDYCHVNDNLAPTAAFDDNDDADNNHNNNYNDNGSTVIMQSTLKSTVLDLFTMYSPCCKLFPALHILQTTQFSQVVQIDCSAIRFKQYQNQIYF